ncbi:MAG: hypothetical protein J0M37_04805 [Ignavibacteria bacterium]|nr:hypothetical protein [Ignavibacteria bacterium]
MRLKKDKKISKGYRLRPETHKMITKVQKILKTDYDDTLTALCAYFLKKNNTNQFKYSKN